MIYIDTPMYYAKYAAIGDQNSHFTAMVSMLIYRLSPWMMVYIPLTLVNYVEGKLVLLSGQLTTPDDRRGPSLKPLLTAKREQGRQDNAGMRTIDCDPDRALIVGRCAHSDWRHHNA